MGTNYDAWLEQPFQDACKAADDYENACELYNETDYYWEGLEEFLKDNPGSDEDAWLESSRYENAVSSYWESINEREPMPDDYPY